MSDTEEKQKYFNLIFKIQKGDRTNKCELCGRYFKEKGNLVTHKKIHTGIRPFKCDFGTCMKSFITLGNLKAHQDHHNGNKPFMCSFDGCKQRYSRETRLEIHSRTHNGKKPYRCPFGNCVKSFNEKGNLKTHYRFHTGERPFICKYLRCSKTFKAHGHLKDHEMMHTRLKPFKCNICLKSYARSGILKNHMRTHPRHRRSQKNNLNASQTQIETNKNLKNLNKVNCEESPRSLPFKSNEQNENNLTNYEKNDNNRQNEINFSSSIDYLKTNFNHDDELEYSKSNFNQIHKNEISNMKGEQSLFSNFNKNYEKQLEASENKIISPPIYNTSNTINANQCTNFNNLLKKAEIITGFNFNNNNIKNFQNTSNITPLSIIEANIKNRLISLKDKMNYEKALAMINFNTNCSNNYLNARQNNKTSFLPKFEDCLLSNFNDEQMLSHKKLLKFIYTCNIVNNLNAINTNNFNTNKNLCPQAQNISNNYFPKNSNLNFGIGNINLNILNYLKNQTGSVNSSKFNMGSVNNFNNINNLDNNNFNYLANLNNNYLLNNSDLLSIIPNNTGGISPLIEANILKTASATNLNMDSNSINLQSEVASEKNIN